MRTKAYLKAEVDPFPAEITLLLVEDDEPVVEVLRDTEDSSDVAHRKYGAVVTAR
jgi:hypothetical protein